MRYCLFILILFLGKITFAHQPDFSTIVFSQTKDGKVVMQINSSLTAFQHEINFHNAENPYQSPEEFKEMVIEHFRKNFAMTINKRRHIEFVNPQVILGHETKIIAEAIGVPEDVKNISIKNHLFKDIHNNQSTVIFALDGFPNDQHLKLSNDNNHEINMQLNYGKWKEYIKKDQPSITKYLLAFYLLVILGLAIFVFRRKS